MKEKYKKRKIHGKIYYLKWWGGYPEDAQTKQEHYKDLGYNAEIIKIGREKMYAVYVRKKIRKSIKKKLQFRCDNCGDPISEYQYNIGKGLCKKCVMVIQ
jgi:formylmethanofuran dehydrogenase subunit E